MDVKHVLVGLEVDGAEVADEAPLRPMLHLRILDAEGRELLLDGDELPRVHGDAGDGDLLGLQRGNHPRLLRGQEDQQGLTVLLVASRPPHSVDVSVGVLGAVQLHHPVHGGEVQSPGRYVCAEEDRGLLAAELGVDPDPLHLLLLPVQSHERDPGTEAAKHLVRELDLLAAGHEDDDFGGEVVPHEGEENVHLLVELAHHVALRQPLWCARHGVLVHGHVLWVLEAQAGKISDRFGLRGREQERLSLPGEVLQDRVHRLFEAQVQDPVRFVQDEDLEREAVEVWGFVHVLEEPPRRADDDVGLLYPLLLRLEVFPADHETRGEIVLHTDFLEDFERLVGQLTRGRNDDGAQAIHRGPPLGPQGLQHRDQES